MPEGMQCDVLVVGAGNAAFGAALAGGSAGKAAAR